MAAKLLSSVVVERQSPPSPPPCSPPRPPRLDAICKHIGYHALAPGRPSARMSTPACVEFDMMLGDDPIFEVHPTSSSGLCNTDGDEGSPVVLRDEGRQVLVGFYVGSVTSFLTDCKKSVQFLDGYESAYGYRSFVAEGLARGKQLAR